MECVDGRCLACFRETSTLQHKDQHLFAYIKQTSLDSRTQLHVCCDLQNVVHYSVYFGNKPTLIMVPVFFLWGSNGGD
jgi:hypothetical protein